MTQTTDHPSLPGGGIRWLDELGVTSPVKLEQRIAAVEAEREQVEQRRPRAMTAGAIEEIDARLASLGRELTALRNARPLIAHSHFQRQEQQRREREERSEQLQAQLVVDVAPLFDRLLTAYDELVAYRQAAASLGLTAAAPEDFSSPVPSIRERFVAFELADRLAHHLHSHWAKESLPAARAKVDGTPVPQKPGPAPVARRGTTLPRRLTEPLRRRRPKAETQPSPATEEIEFMTAALGWARAVLAGDGDAVERWRREQPRLAAFDPRLAGHELASTEAWLRARGVEVPAAS